MSNLIAKKASQVLSGMKEVFVYFDNSAINRDAQIAIQSLITIVKEKTNDSDINIEETLTIVGSLITNINTAVEDALNRSAANYSSEQTLEKKAVCDLFKARMSTLEMMLKVRIK